MDEMKNSNIRDVNHLVDLMAEFTDVYKSFNGNDREAREVACWSVQWRGMAYDIKDDDLFAGRFYQLPIGCQEQSIGGGLGYYISVEDLQTLFNDATLSELHRSKLHAMKAYWQEEQTMAKAKMAFPPEMKKALPGNNHAGEPGIAFPLWRMAGTQLDYRKLVNLGIPGLRNEILSYKKTVKNGDALKLYTAMEKALDIYVEAALYYAQMAEYMAEGAADEARRKELLKMGEVLRKTTLAKPSSFREGLQLIFLYNGLNGIRNYGRLDDALGDLYAFDLEDGILSEEEAVRLLCDVWKLIASRDNIWKESPHEYKFDGRIIIGGKGRSNEANANKLAYAILEATKRTRDIVPQLALRFYDGQDTGLYRKALDMIGSGNPYPMLYNDDVNIPSAQKAFDVPYEEAVHVIQYGCGEYVLNHRSVGTPSGLINLLQALLVTMNKGVDPTTGLEMGMPRDWYERFNDFTTFDDLFAAYKTQVEYHIEQLAQHEQLEYAYAGKDNPYLFSSILMDDCISRGKALYSGGVRYLGGTLETYGNTNTADSLVATRKLVYEQKLFTLDKLVHMLHHNFDGFEQERKLMLSCPKYGNDSDEADNMYIDVHEHLCNFTNHQKERTSLHSYLVVIINNDANTTMGMHTAASPDGRKAYTYMANANNPTGGADKNGVTAMLNSLVKPRTDIHAGAVQNMRFSAEMFTKERWALEALLETYFEKGGSQAMITVLNRNDLENAMKFPERYQNLIVRVGGFSERFVNLPPEVQKELLSRTMYARGEA